MIRTTTGSGSALDIVPKQMLCDISRDPNEALDGFIQGLDQKGGHIGIADVPWYAWTRTLGFWLPLTVVLFIALVGLSMVVHRQWARHEHLPYPIVTFTESLLPDDSGTSSIFRNRLFWMSTLALVVYHLNNYAYVWFPQHLIPIPRSLNFVGLAPLFRTLMDGGGWGLLRTDLKASETGSLVWIKR